MRLNDVWRNVNDEIGIYCKGEFDRVPRVGGVYAWFYPLKITTTDLTEYLKELDAVFSFDAFSGFPPEKKAIVRFTWKSLHLRLTELRRPPTSPDELSRSWAEIVSNEARFYELRKVLLKASILMPPLYVGKSNDLFSRCWQHIRGTAGSGFYDRFMSHAASHSLKARGIQDLLFVCIKTPPTEENLEEPDLASDEAAETVVEELLKFVSQPPYGKK